MTLYEFNTLDLNGRAAAAWEGKHLGTRLDHDRRILVYSLPDFYAEVFYDAASNEITECRGFKSLHLLAPYLEIKTSGFSVN